MVDGSDRIISANATKLGGFLSKSETNPLGDFEEFILASDVNHDGKVDSQDKDLLSQAISNGKPSMIDQNYYVSNIKDLQIIYNQ